MKKSRKVTTLVARVAEAIRNGRRILLTSHPSPDGDAVGSMAATLLVLHGLGKEAVAYNPDPVPQRYRFLPATREFVTRLPPGPFDTTLVLDCSDDRVLGGVDPATLGTVVVIDHHKTAGTMGHIVLRDPRAAAVGVLLYNLFKRLGVLMTTDIADALFCSIMSDTGSFRYQNTNAEAMRVVAALLERGVDPWRVSSSIYEERPRCELELLGRVLQTLSVSPEGWAASLTVTPEMLDATGCTPDMIDGFINYARGVQGVEVAILMRPGPGEVRVSLRSRGRVDVARIAERFGGGGHRNAAGFVVQQDPGQVQAGLFSEVSRALSRA